MSETKAEINQCPKCGNKDVYCLETDMCRYDMYQVVCENIPDDSEELWCFEGPEFKEDKQSAIDAWNKINATE